MRASSTIATAGTRPRTAPHGRRWVWLIGAPLAAVIIAVVAVVGHFLDEPMRRRLERTLNQRMTGYAVRLPGLDFHPLGFSLTLHKLTVRQNAKPEPPVAVIDTLEASVHWRALLRLRLVADFELDRPRIHVNRPQMMQEAADPVPVEDKGWQEALEAIYPLKINEFRVTDATLTYVDDDPKRPLHVSRANFLATNVRNVSSPDRTYPSPIRLDAVVFERGRLEVDGHANFLAVPHAGMRADIDLRNVPLDRLKPVAVHANLHISEGTLAELLAGVEYAPRIQDVHVQRLRVHEVLIDYVHSSETAAAEARRIEKVKDKAEELANRPTASITADVVSVRNSTFGFVNEAASPNYRLFLDDANLEVRGFSNRSEAKPVAVDLTGDLNATGRTKLKASFLPRQRDPELQSALQIEGADMRSMNDLFRANGDFDVVDGRFSFYSEIEVKDGRIDGYVKPLFEDLDVYDRAQDSGESVFQQAYEGLVGGVGRLLENREDQVATQATVSGRTDSPDVSTLEVVINLVRNAFFDAILPGLDRAVRRAGAVQGAERAPDDDAG